MPAYIFVLYACVFFAAGLSWLTGTASLQNQSAIAGTFSVVFAVAAGLLWLQAEYSDWRNFRSSLKNINALDLRAEKYRGRVVPVTLRDLLDNQAMWGEFGRRL